MMDTIVIEHVNASELPDAWRRYLPKSLEKIRLKIRIDEEDEPLVAATLDKNKNFLFGLWRDRDDISDISMHVRQIRQGRFEQLKNVD